MGHNSFLKSDRFGDRRQFQLCLLYSATAVTVTIVGRRRSPLVVVDEQQVTAAAQVERIW